jgi:hypothetical protein
MWFASAAYSIAQSSIEDKPGDPKEVAVERVAKLYYKVLAFQEPDPHQSQVNLSPFSFHSYQKKIFFSFFFFQSLDFL